MLMILLAAGAAASSQPAATMAVATAPVAGRTLKDLPNTTIGYYDVPGKDGTAIEKSLKKMLADPAARAAHQLFTWTIGAQISRHTVGTTCTVASAQSSMTSAIQLPRLTTDARLDKEAMASWNKYVAGLENDAAANLWFVHDRIKGVEQSMVGVGCDQAGAKWDAGIAGVKTDYAAFAAARARTAKNPVR